MFGQGWEVLEDFDAPELAEPELAVVELDEDELDFFGVVLARTAVFEVAT